MSVDIFISIVVIVAIVFSLLGIRYPLFIIPAMSLSLIWFAYMAKIRILTKYKPFYIALLQFVPLLLWRIGGLTHDIY